MQKTARLSASVFTTIPLTCPDCGGKWQSGSFDGFPALLCQHPTLDNHPLDRVIIIVEGEA